MHVYLNSPLLFGAFAQQIAQNAGPSNQLVLMLNEKAENQSPLETAQQALLNAKAKLDEQRNERIENALGGYRALRSRQTSYESGLQVQQEWLEKFQTLNSRRNELTDELSSARADYEACIATESTLDIAQHNRLFSLENEFASVNHDITALVKQASRYMNSQRQYANYLKNTGQNGYAAYEYQVQPEYTEENFVFETASMIRRMETGAKQWRDRVSSYCAEYGLSPYDFESYLQERHKLADAYFAAQQRVSELLYATESTTVRDVAQAKSTQDSTIPAKDNFDMVEISDSGRKYIQQTFPQSDNTTEATPKRNILVGTSGFRLSQLFI